VTGVDICDDNTPGSGSGQACFDYIMQVIADTLDSPGDSDDDGLPDDWEIDNFGNLDQDGTSDLDGDGLGNLDEFNAGTDPNNPDTDGDGYIKVELHPKDSDFASGKQGRVMISTKQDDVYHTEVKTTKDDKVAQTADGKVKITAHLTPAAASVGKTVYFRVVDPDSDDKSSYETDATKGDNRATADKPGKLSATSDTAVLKTINGVQVAAAEVELTITGKHSGCRIGTRVFLPSAWYRLP